MQTPQISIVLQRANGYISHTVDPIRDSNISALYKRVLNGEMTPAEAYEVFTKATNWLHEIFSNVEVYSAGGCIDENDENTIYEFSISI